MKEAEKAVLHTQKLESLGVMAGGIAHDFNNLLVGVTGNVSLALSKVAEGTELHSYLVDIEMAADRARDLTQQLLAYAGKGRFALESIDLSEVVREVTNLLDVSSPKGSNDVSTFGKTCPQSAETVRSYTRSS